MLTGGKDSLCPSAMLIHHLAYKESVKGVAKVQILVVWAPMSDTNDKKGPLNLCKFSKSYVNLREMTHPCSPSTFRKVGFFLNMFIYNWTDFKQSMSGLPHHPDLSPIVIHHKKKM